MNTLLRNADSLGELLQSIIPATPAAKCVWGVDGRAFQGGYASADNRRSGKRRQRAVQHPQHSFLGQATERWLPSGGNWRKRQSPAMQPLDEIGSIGVQRLSSMPQNFRRPRLLPASAPGTCSSTLRNPESSSRSDSASRRQGCSHGRSSRRSGRRNGELRYACNRRNRRNGTLDRGRRGSCSQTGVAVSSTDQSFSLAWVSDGRATGSAQKWWAPTASCGC